MQDSVDPMFVALLVLESRGVMCSVAAKNLQTGRFRVSCLPVVNFYTGRKVSAASFFC